jgi:hypothetical protein
MPEAPEPRAQPPRPAPKRRRRPSPLSVITAALGLFFVVLTLLAIQVRNGRDPALGPGPIVPALSQPAAKGGTTAAATQATEIVTRTSPAPPP